MTAKADFNAEEWTTVVEGPLFAGMRVIAADRGGTIRESLAMGKVYTHAREQEGGESGLLDEIVATPPAVDRKALGTPEDIPHVTMDRLRQALAIVQAKATPEELETYKRFVVSVAQAAAQAHKEGGHFGIGGTEISEAEQAALDEISATLNP